MATRNILHISKLQEFEDFLETKGYMIVAKSKNPYEVLRAQKDGDTVIVYQKKDAKEHLSTMDKDYRLVREFIKRQRKESNADRIRGMNDEELATMLCNTCTYSQFSGEPMFSIGIDDGVDIPHSYGDILDWLKQSVEE